MTPSGGGDDDDDGARVESIGVIEGVDRLRDGQGNCVCVCVHACMLITAMVVKYISVVISCQQTSKGRDRH